MYIFGSGYDQVAGQKNLYDEQAIRLALADQQARQQAVNQTQQNYIFAQRQAEEDARQQDDIVRQQAAQLRSEQDRQQQLNRQDYQFNVGRQDQAKADAESRRRFDVETGFKTRAEDFQKTQVNTADTRMQLNDLVKMAQNGSIPADANMGELFPNLSSSQIAWAKKFATLQSEEQSKQLQDLATQATRMVKSVAGEPKPVSTSSWYNPLSWWSTKPGSGLTENDAFKHLNSFKELRDYAPMLQWDATSQQFVAPGGHVGPSKYDFGTPAPLSPNVRGMSMTVPPPVAPGTSPEAALPEGTIIRSKQDGNTYIIKGGQRTPYNMPALNTTDAAQVSPPIPRIDRSQPASLLQEGISEQTGSAANQPVSSGYQFSTSNPPVELPATSRTVAPKAAPAIPGKNYFGGEDETGMIPLSGDKGRFQDPLGGSTNPFHNYAKMLRSENETVLQRFKEVQNRYPNKKFKLVFVGGEPNPVDLQYGNTVGTTGKQYYAQEITDGNGQADTTQ